jgi:hypothetical protein
MLPDLDALRTPRIAHSRTTFPGTSAPSPRAALGPVLDQPATGGQLAVDLHPGERLRREVGGDAHAPRVPIGTAMATG